MLGTAIVPNEVSSIWKSKVVILSEKKKQKREKAAYTLKEIACAVWYGFISQLFSIQFSWHLRHSNMIHAEE